MKLFIAATLIAGLSLVGSSNAAAQDATIGLGAGLVKPENIDATAWITANVRVALQRNVYLEPEVGYWRKTFDNGRRFRDFSAGANLYYMFPSQGIDYYAGAGLGVDSFRNTSPLGIQSGTDNELSVHLIAGAEGRVSSGVTLFGSLRYDIVQDLNLFKVYGGLRFGL